jgi:hypothetical protein
MGVGLLSERLSLVRPKPTYTLFLFTQSNLRHLGELFGELKRVQGMFMRLRAEFMRGKMVSLAVGDRRSFVGVGCEVVEF